MYTKSASCYHNLTLHPLQIVRITCAHSCAVTAFAQCGYAVALLLIGVARHIRGVCSRAASLGIDFTAIAQFVAAKDARNVKHRSFALGAFGGTWSHHNTQLEGENGR